MANRNKSFEVRFWEVLPGILTWATLLGAPIFAYFLPVWISVFIILFDTYWFLKAGNVAIHLLHSYATLRSHNKIDWSDWLKRLADKREFRQYLTAKLASEPRRTMRAILRQQLSRLDALETDRNLDWNRLYHLIIIPTYRESYEVLAQSIRSYFEADYPQDKLIFVLAYEERSKEVSLPNAERLKRDFGDRFFRFLTVMHPDGLPGEAKGKGANISYGAREAQKLLDELSIPYEDVLVSAFDSDTAVHRNYFSHLSYDFLTVRKPLQASYQPMPMFHNNIWDTPAIARVIATSSSFWQLVEASRPDRLVTFSSHSMNFKTLVDVGFWRVDIIPEDSHIFWQCFLHFNGDYRSEPLFTTVSMDAVLGESYFGTLVAQYKQKRRWAWGVTEISLVFPELLRDRRIPAWKRFLYSERLVVGHYFWATSSIMIAVLGWLPLIFGGARFGSTVLAVNLPMITRVLMTVATFFLIFSMYINMVLLPPRPAKYGRIRTLAMVLQWVLSPIVSSVFGSMPAIDAQTRLLFAKYMEFWVTPKIRKSDLESDALAGTEGAAALGKAKE
ncbi:MAG: glycosyltransferase [Candidatus Saccharibacteria bacterium]